MSVTKLIAAKAVLAVVGVTGGGVALAAATGHLPANLTGTPAAATSAASATAMPSGTGQPAGHPTASPSPSLRGLCQAYTAKVGGNPGKALDNPAFSTLISAAGGKDKVTAYCTSLLAAAPGNSPASHPGGKPSSLPADHSTAQPGTVPTDHPTGQPSTVPTGHATGQPGTVATSHPTGASTSHP